MDITCSAEVCQVLTSSSLFTSSSKRRVSAPPAFPLSVCCIGRLMPPGRGPRLRYLLQQLHHSFDAVADCHESVRVVLEALDSAAQECFPSGPSKSKGRPHLAPLARICCLRNKLHYVRSRLRKAQRDLADIKDGKQRQRKNRMTSELLGKVSLSWPTTCARGFVGAWQDLVGVGVAGCSRPTISNIRDGFVEVRWDPWMVVPIDICFQFPLGCKDGCAI